MNRRLIVIPNLICFALTLSSCNGGSGSNKDTGSGDQSVPGSGRSLEEILAVKYSSSVTGSMSAEKVSTLSDSPVSLLFGTISVSLYHYRPKEDPQTQLANADVVYNDGSTWGTYGPDWSHWDVLPHGGAGDFYLPSGSEVDLKTVPSSWLGQSAFRQITSIRNSAEYTENVGSFGIDIVYVKGTPSIINENQQVCGHGYLAWHQPGDFPFLDFFGGCRGRNLKSAYDNTYIGDLRTIFVRKDWFGQPVVVYPVIANTGEVRCFSTDLPLTPFQEEIFESFMNAEMQGHWEKGMYRNTCAPNPVAPTSPITIVPQNSVTHVIKLSESGEATTYLTTPDNNQIPNSGSALLVNRAEVKIGFALRPSLILNYSSLLNSGDQSEIMIDRTADGFPMGLSVEITPMEDGH